jgi:hypothetical protein
MTMANATQAAETAHAISECMNLLFLFAAPRVYATYRWSAPTKLDHEAAEACLHRFLRTAAGIRQRAAAAAGDIDRVVRTAQLVEEICGGLPSARFDEAIPSAIVESARSALVVLGFPPPAGGWDDFEGFPVPLPPAQTQSTHAS